MDLSEQTIAEGQIAADLMLRNPKTLPGDVSVAEVRVQLANPKVQMVLLAEGRTFLGAITTIPAGAADDEQALAYADPKPETISQSAPSVTAYERAAASPHRRVIVLADDGGLVGLLCLDPSRTRFCQTPN